jgi:V8-like Glu-specific endopeptidase
MPHRPIENDMSVKQPAQLFSRILALAAATVVAGDVASARDPWPGIIGTDDRVVVEADGAPWDAIGQVNIGGLRSRGQCTGTLVAPDLVLTAAHCVLDARKNRPHPLRHVHFLAAVRRATHKGHATAKCLRFLKDARPSGAEGSGRAQPGKRLSVRRAPLDVAVIVLDRSLAIAPAPLATGVPGKAGLRLLHAAYPANRRHLLSAHRGCRLLHTAEAGVLWLNDCDTHHASSGGPVFASSEGELQLAAVMIGGLAGRRANVAVPIAEWLDLVRQASCRP